jgi:uncharacterized metal-binding protein YceD (DUF177 family)
MDKHHPLWDSGGISLKRLVREDVAVGAYAHLTIRTRVWNPSHRCLTQVD